MAIGEYFIGGYCQLLMAIDEYLIGGYWWLFLLLYQ